MSRVSKGAQRKYHAHQIKKMSGVRRVSQRKLKALPICRDCNKEMIERTREIKEIQSGVITIMEVVFYCPKCAGTKVRAE